MKKLFTVIGAIWICAFYSFTQPVDIFGPDTMPNCQASFEYASYDLSVNLVSSTGYPYEFTGHSMPDSAIFYWDFGDGTTAIGRTVYHTFPRKKDAVEVCLSIVTLEGCESSVCKQLVLGGTPPPVHGCEISFDIEVMESYPPQYRFVPEIPDSLGQFYWDLGDGQFSYEFSPVHMYEFSNRYVISLYYSSADSCTAFATDTISAEGFLQCNAFWESYTNTLIDSTANDYHPVTNHYIFNDRSMGDVVKWEWNLGDGTYSDQMNVEHVYAESGVYTVCLNIKTADSCHSSYCSDIYVDPEFACDFTGTVKDYTGLDGCGLIIKLDNGIVLEPVEIKQNFSLYDGQRVRLSYTELNNRASICMMGIIARINCISEIPDSCSAVFNHYALPWVSSVPPIYQFEPLVDSSYATLWDLGDGTITNEYNPMHRFPHDGYYTICLTISNSNGCSNTYCQTDYFEGYESFPVLCDTYIRLTTDFILNGQTCNGSASAALVDAFGNPVNVTAYLWSTGETVPSISGLCPGSTYSVVVKDSSGCAVSGSFSIGNSIIYPDSLIGYWNYEQDNLDFVFNVPILKDDVYCEWDFGDGIIAQGSSVTHSYDSVIDYTVTFRVFDNLGNMLYDQQIAVSPGDATDIDNPESASLSVYPVPAQDRLFITLPNNNRVSRLDVVASSGQAVQVYTYINQVDENIELDVSELPAGFYIGRLTYNNGIHQVFRFVK
jgi:PKD repeat protein